MSHTFLSSVSLTGKILLLASSVAPLLAQQSTQSGQDRMQQARPLTQTIAGTSSLAKKIGSGNRKALSLATGDFFEDGTVSLATAYAVAGAGVIAMQHGTALNGGTSAPFADTATVTDAGTRPDILKVADVNGDGHLDLVVAARGGSSFQVLFGNGRGGFTAAPAISTSGRITALATWHDPSMGRELIALGLCGSGCSVALYHHDGAVLASVPVAGTISVIETARLNGSQFEDILAGGKDGLELIDGRMITGPSPQTDRLPVSSVAAVACGSFVYDRRGFLQVAVLSTDGSVHILGRNGVDRSQLTVSDVQLNRQNMRQQQRRTAATNTSTLAWSDLETLSSVAPLSGRTAPLLLRSHLSGSGEEDLIVLNANGGQMTTIAHPVISATVTDGDSANSAVLPARITMESTATGDVMAAAQVRMSQDSRMGLVLAQGQAQPSIALPATNRTINVNTTADGAVTTASRNLCINNSAGCTMRSAIAVANSDASTNETNGRVDTVNVPAGTFTLSSNSGLDAQGSVTYHIEIAGPVNIVGAGAAATTITTSNLDKIFSINSGIVNTQVGFNVFFSNLTMTNGTNTNNYNTQPSSNAYGGLMDWETSGTGNLTINNCSFTNGTILWGPGGAIYVSDTPIGPGVFEIDNSTISGSKSPEQGGGIYLGDDVPLILNSVTITGNQANPAVNSSDNASGGSGGGLFNGIDTGITRQGSIVNSTISSNSALTGNGEGGGVFSLSGLVITNTSVTGNASGANGGGLYLVDGTSASSLTSLTVTGNSAVADGGGITIQALTSALTPSLKYSRITGNTGGAHTGLANGVKNGTQSSTIDARFNFWGCNGAAAGTGCDTAGNDGGSGALTLTPYAAVSASLNTTTPAVGTALVLTGDIAHDSTGTALGSGNLAAFAVVNAALNITQGVSTLYSAITPLSSAASASSSSVSITAGGAGTATFKVDNATVSLPFTGVAPPSLTPSFGAALIALNGTTSLTLRISNPSTSVTLTGISFTDSLPTGLVVATLNGLSNTCAGTATAASGTISLSGGSVAANTNCAVTVNVTGTSVGSKLISATSIASTNGGTGLSSTATLIVNAPVVDSLSFGAASVALGGTTSIRFGLAANASNGSSLTGIAFSDTLPVGLVISSPAVTNNGCGGTLTATAGSGSVTYSGGSLAAGGSCTVSVNVTAKSSGTKSATFTASSTTIGAGNAAMASLTVTQPVFASAISFTTGGTGAGSLIAVTADFNGDGRPDVAVANLANSSVSVLFGNSSGGLQAATTYPVGFAPYGLVAGDFNGDGKPDLAVVNAGASTISILLNNGSGGFPALNFTYNVGSGPYGISIGDFNKDGRPDLAVTNNGSKTISVLLGNANGSFQAPVSYATGNYPFGTAVGDLNNDGYPDLVVWNIADNNVGVLLNDKTGKFAAQVTYATGLDPYSVSLGDFNGDGFLDMAVANLGSNTVGVLLNDKTGKFGAQTAYATGVEPTSVLAQDMNGDGVPDLVVTNLSDGTISLFPCNGDGTFLAPIVAPAGAQPYASVAADFNGDGLTDLAVTNFVSNTVAILLQSSSGVNPLLKTKITPDRVSGVARRGEY